MREFISEYLKFGLNIASLSVFGVLIIVSSITYLKARKSRKWRSFFKVQPTIWTAAGIIGTFFSLLVGFSDIQNLSKNSEAINDLPVILSNAFVTSILGLIGAMIINVILSQMEDTNGEEEHFIEPPEKFLFDLKNNSFAQNNSIIDALHTLNGNLIAIDKRLEASSTSLVEKFDQTMKSVSQSVKQNINEINKDMFDQISGVFTEFKDISNQAGSHFKELNQNNVSIITAEMKTLMKKLSDEVSKVQSNISQESEGFIKTQQESLLKQVEKNEAFQKISLEKNEAFLNDQLIKFESVTKSLNNFSKSQQEVQAENFKAVNTSQKEAVESFLKEISAIKQESIQSSEKANESLSKLIDSIESKTKEVLETIHKDFEKVSNGLQNWATLTEQGLNATAARLKDSVTSFDDQRENHKKTIEQAEIHLATLVDLSKSEELYSQRLESYEERTNELASAVIQLKELVELLKEFKETNGKVSV
ncbi:hypothetical protein GCM10027284_09710 [Cyclobacterium sediminis]